MATISSATATWNGVLKSGKGSFEAGSGAFAGDYTFATRFESARGTNPEELIAAAHAACLSMALAADLERARTPATRITTKATATMDTVDGKPTIARIALEVRGTVAGIDQKAFAKAAADAKSGCPVSRALTGNVRLELNATLEP